jgi:ribulose-phosphate 3-epimerase
MTSWASLPRDRLLADVSLWSADLANVAAGIARMAPFADSFHLDVSDARFASNLLFFPDMVAAMRPHTDRPFHVHLMAERPTQLVPAFVEAGADAITVHAELDKAEVTSAIEAIRTEGRCPGLALRLDTPLTAALPYIDRIDSLLLLGTEIGVKAQDLAPDACARLAEASRILRERNAPARLIADGGIRRQTAPQLRRAGADIVVPGSLVFQSTDLAATFNWLHQLDVHPA